MIALLLASFAQLFWQRELGLLKREVLEDRTQGEERMLFDELISLATCAPLPPLSQPSPMRQLVRVEAARRVRLGKAAASSNTIWRDLLRPRFFSFAIDNPKPSKALYWSEEREKWPNETLLVQPPVSLCGKPPAGSAEEPITDELVRAQEPGTAALLAYERAAVQFRAGKPVAALALDADQLPKDLRPYGRFLRLESGAEPREGFAALAAALPLPIVIDRAAQALADDPKARHSAAGLSLQGEAAFVAGDAGALRDALAQLFPSGGGYGRGALAGAGGPRAPVQLRVADRDERDHAAVALAQALAGRAAQRPEWTALLDAAFERMRDGVHVRYAREIDLAADASRSTVARDLQRVALGEIQVVTPPQPPPPPRAELELPEPFSLLAIPHDDGSLRSWFASPEVADAR